MSGVQVLNNITDTQCGENLLSAFSKFLLPGCEEQALERSR